MVFLKHRYELIIDTHRKNAGNAGPDTDYVDMLYFAETLYYRLESVRRKSKRVSSGDQNIADLLVGADIIQFFIEFFDSRTAVALAYDAPSRAVAAVHCALRRYKKEDPVGVPVNYVRRYRGSAFI